MNGQRLRLLRQQMANGVWLSNDVLVNHLSDLQQKLVAAGFGYAAKVETQQSATVMSHESGK